MLLFKEHKNSLGFIENIPECSAMGEVFFLFVLFSADTQRKELLNSFIFKWDLKPF